MFRVKRITPYIGRGTILLYKCTLLNTYKLWSTYGHLYNIYLHIELPNVHINNPNTEKLVIYNRHVVCVQSFSSVYISHNNNIVVKLLFCAFGHEISSKRVSIGILSTWPYDSFLQTIIYILNRRIWNFKKIMWIIFCIFFYIIKVICKLHVMQYNKYSEYIL